MFGTEIQHSSWSGPRYLSKFSIHQAYMPGVDLLILPEISFLYPLGCFRWQQPKTQSENNKTQVASTLRGLLSFYYNKPRGKRVLEIFKYLISPLNIKYRSRIPSIFLLCYVQHDFMWAPFMVVRWCHSSRKYIQTWQHPVRKTRKDHISSVYHAFEWRIFFPYSYPTSTFPSRLPLTFRWPELYYHHQVIYKQKGTYIWTNSSASKVLEIQPQGKVVYPNSVYT